MSVVDDVRKVLQDFPAPEQRAISVCLGATEARMSDQFAHVDPRFTAMDQRLTQLELQLQQGKQDIFRAINALADYKTPSERVTRIESKEAQTHSL